MFTINGERLTFALTNEQDKQFSISAATDDEKHWELQSIDENSAKLFTNGEYPLATLKTIVENILVRQINDPDITVNISQVKEDLLVIMIVKEKWVERKVTLQFDSKKQATEIERLETLLSKTRRELVEMKASHEEQIKKLIIETNILRHMINQSKYSAVLGPVILGHTAQNRFQNATEQVKNFSKRPTTDEVLQLYGLYTQATDNIYTSQSWGIQVEARMEWDFWNKLKGMSKQDAQIKYIELAERLKTIYQ
jgi:acyl-CoA-binding protein